MTDFLTQNFAWLISGFFTVVTVVAGWLFSLHKKNLDLTHSHIHEAIKQNRKEVDERVSRHREEIDMLHLSNKEIREKIVTKDDLERAITRIIESNRSIEKLIEVIRETK